MIVFHGWKKFLNVAKYVQKHGLLRSFFKLQAKTAEHKINIAYNDNKENRAAKNANKTTDGKTVKISVVVPVYNTKEEFLRAMILSLKNQTYDKWELCIADASDAPYAALREFVGDRRIKTKRIQNQGIAANTNAAISMATGDYVAFLDHDDLLAKEALYEIAQAVRGAKERDDGLLPDIIYTDEDETDARGEKFFAPHFKPKFSPALLEGYNYICHLTVFKRALDNVRPEFDGAQDYDFVLRAAELTEKILHIPKVLYHWRTHGASTAAGAAAKPYTHEAGRRAVEEHIKRLKKAGQVLDVCGGVMNTYRVKYSLTYKINLSVFLMNADVKDEREFIKRLTNKPDTVTVNVFAVSSLSEIHRKAVGEWIMIADGKIRPQGDFISELLAECTAGGAAAAGGEITGKYGYLLPVGYFMSSHGVVASHGGFSKYSEGYIRRLLVKHEYDAVNPMFMVFSRRLYEIFAEEKEGDWRLSMIKFCFNVAENGGRIVFTPFATATIKKYVPIDFNSFDKTNGSGYYNPNYKLLSMYYKRESRE